MTNEVRRRRFAWWSPLLVPVVLLSLMTLDLGSKGVHVVRSTYLGAFTGDLLIALVVGVPAFAAGRML